MHYFHVLFGSQLDPVVLAVDYKLNCVFLTLPHSPHRPEYQFAFLVKFIFAGFLRNQTGNTFAL